jgi:hypothetical protein
MTLGHPKLCDVLDQAAQRAGAKLLRGIANVTIDAGLPPTVAFDHEGERHTVQSRPSSAPMDDREVKVVDRFNCRHGWNADLYAELMRTLHAYFIDIIY